MTPESPIQTLRTVISRSSNAILHLHLNPDGDSIGSALSSAQMLEQMGVAATVIRGDSQMPSYFRHPPGVKIAAHLVETGEEETRVSLRTNFPEIDVSDIAAVLGGGGHRAAAGVGIGLPLDRAHREVLSAIRGSGQFDVQGAYAYALPAALGSSYSVRV